MGKVLKVLSHSEFEAGIDAEVGDIVKAGDIVAIVSSIHQEEPEYIKYLSELEKEEIRRFLPDISEGKKIARCIALCKTNLSEARHAPKIGEEVERVEDGFLRQIHYANGELRMPYLIFLLQRCRDVGVTRSLILKLMDLIPEERDLLEIILAEIEYSRMRGVEL
jgi:DNA-directed RNA polymerase subunit F